jgi:transcriptional regulator with XRE-family HTH domain
MKTGILIKELRIKKGMTQEELADKTELSARTIQRIENGEVDPRAYTLQMIAKALDVEFSVFLEAESDESQEIQKVNDNNWLGLLHLSGLVPLILPAVLIWNLKKDKIKGITGHYRAVISFQLMVLGVLLGCLWVYWKVNILTPFIGVLLANSMFTIFNTLQVMSGKPYKRFNIFKSNNKGQKGSE